MNLAQLNELNNNILSEYQVVEYKEAMSNDGRRILVLTVVAPKPVIVRGPVVAT